MNKNQKCYYYDLKENNRFVRWFKRNNHKYHFYLELNEIQGMVEKISSWYTKMASDKKLVDIENNNINLLNEYFLFSRLTDNISRQTTWREMETLKSNYRIGSSQDSLKVERENYWLDYFWLSIKKNNKIIYIGVDKNGAIRQEDALKYFPEFIKNKFLPLTLKSLYIFLSNSNNVDLTEVKHCLDTYESDQILKEIITYAIVEKISFAKEQDFITNLKKARHFIDDINNFGDQKTIENKLVLK
ncbi:MAG TPA: hypothetical protein GXZ95_03520 [Mollicutes bacterium]|nr:hypothetical protein [Mollicutes bacterium]